MQSIAIAGIQMHLSAIQPNIQRMRQRLDVTMDQFPWIEMVVFSELAAFGPLISHAQPLPGPAEEQFCEMAAKHKIWLIPGSLYEKTDDIVYNTASVINPKGEVIGRYRKMFPFMPYEEGVEAGNEFLVFDIPDRGRFGVSICYDSWMPETSRTMAAMGAEVILHPSLTATIDRDVELAIARSTAASNQCFFLDINGVGDGGNGRSIFVGPAGDILHQAGSTAEVIPIEINLERVARSRERGLRGLGQPLKSFRDRTVDFRVYGEPSPYLERLGALEKPRRAGEGPQGKQPY